MKYELLKNSQRGVAVDRTPIMRDIKDTFVITFILPQAGTYLALFKSLDGLEYKVPICDSKCNVPPQLLKKEQSIDLVVLLVEHDEINNAWDCEPIKITAYFNIRESQRQVSVDTSSAVHVKRLEQLERLYNLAVADLARFMQECDELQGAIKELRERNEANERTIVELNESHNETIQLVTILKARVLELEKSI